ncbi:MAG: hypothetical protein WAL41_05840, partial [Mycobacterium sp.]
FPATQGDSLDELYQTERSLLDGYGVIPLFHLPVASATSERVRNGKADPLGAWNGAGASLADVWLGDSLNSSHSDWLRDSRPDVAPR